MNMNSRKFIPLALACTPAIFAVALHPAADNPAKRGDVTEARIAAESATGANWFVNGRTFDSKHFSPLAQINDQNVGQLSLAWSLDVDSAMGIVSEPIVVDGVAYVSAPLPRFMQLTLPLGNFSGSSIHEFALAWPLTVPTLRAPTVVSLSGMEEYLSVRGTAASLPSTQPQEKKFGKRRSAIPRKRESPVHLTLPRGAYSLVTTAPTTAFAARSSPMTPTLVISSGASGPCLEIPQRKLKPRRSKWLRKLGTVTNGGASAAVTSGTRSPTTMRQDS